MKKGIVLLVALAIAGFVAASSAFTVQEGQQALVLRFGKIVRTIDTAGLYFRTPFAEDIEFMQKRLLTLEMCRPLMGAVFWWRRLPCSGLLDLKSSRKVFPVTWVWRVHALKHVWMQLFVGFMVRAPSNQLFPMSAKT